MIQAKGAFGPAYNIQISTDAKAKVIVGVGVSQSSRDAGELEAAVERIETNLGKSLSRWWWTPLIRRTRPSRQWQSKALI